MEIKADLTSFLEKLISNPGLYFIVVLGVVIVFGLLIFKIKSEVIKNFVIIIFAIIVIFVFLLIFLSILPKDYQQEKLSENNSKSQLILYADIYGHVRLINSKPNNDGFLNNVKLEVKGANGSRLQELSGKNGKNGYFRFEKIPITSSQKTVLVYPELDGFALKDYGEQFVKAKINSETDIFMKKVK